MWDKHRQIRQHSRKRAMRAARVRASERGGGTVQADAPEQETEPEEFAVEQAPCAEPAQFEIDAPPEPDTMERMAHDPANSLAWTGLILLTLLLLGFMGAVMFMMG